MELAFTEVNVGLLARRVGQLAKLIHKDACDHGLWEDFRKEMEAFTDLPDDIRLRAVRYYATRVVAGEVSELRAASEDKAHYADEAADVIISMLSTMVEMDIDVEAALYAKIMFNHTRPWKHEENNDGQK